MGLRDLLRRAEVAPKSVMMVDGYRLSREAPASRPTLETLVAGFIAGLQGGVASPRLIERVWVASRCVQLTCQQIASMPLRFFGAPSSSEPAWLSNPDPVWYPNGIGDAVFAAVRSMYGWGDAFLYVTDRYASGFPSAWTVLDPEVTDVQLDSRGRRAYRSGQMQLNADNVIQISRNPSGKLRGTSALAAHGAQMLGALASADLSRAIMDGGIPNAVLKSQRKLTQDQAEKLQNQWIERTVVRRGAPAVLPPDIDFETLAFSPKDLLLLDAQEFDARVIAAAFGLPAFLLNLPLVGGLTYQNPEMLFTQWWLNELRPAATRVQRALTANMLPRGSWVEFDARDVLAPDFANLVDAWVKLLAANAVTVEEFRAAVLRLPPQSGQQSIEDLMQPPVAATSQQTGATVQPLRPAQEVTG